MLRLGLLLVLLTGCARQQPPDELYQSARESIRRGDLAQAEATAGRGIQLAQSRGDEVARLRFHLLRAEILLGNRRAQEVLPLLREPVPQTSKFASLRARQRMLEGRALMALGKLEDAGPVLQDAHSRAETAGDDEVLLEIENLNGSRLVRLRRWDEAETDLQRALARARTQRSSYFEAGILVNLGMSRVVRQRYDEAAGFFERAVGLAGSEAGTLHSVAQANLATCYYRLGDFDRAIELQLSAVKEHEQSGARLFLQQALGETANSYLLKGDPKHAIGYLHRAISIANELQRKSDAAIWAGNLSAAYSEIGSWDEAEKWNAEAMRLKGQGNPATLVYNTLNAARIDLGRGQYSNASTLYREALRSGENNPAVQWDAYSGLGTAAVGQQQPGVAARYFEDAIGVVERTRSDLLRTEFKLPFLTRLIRVYQQYVDLLVEQKKTGRALAVADSSRGQVLAEGSRTAAVTRVSAEALQRVAREHKSVLLSYWLAPKRSYVWVVGADRIRCVALPSAGEIEALVVRYRSAVEQQLADPLASRLPEAKRLSEILLEPVRQWIPEGSRVIIAADGVLNGLNFETLPVDDENPHYWIEDVTVALAPSLSRLVQTGELKPPSARGLLLLGDPVTNDKDFPSLIHARREVESVSSRFPAAKRLVLQGASATPAAFRNAHPDRFDTIHFTAHAAANRESPLDSAVVLSGGKLYARDVMSMPLQADLVTISACRGVGLRAYSGEGLVGFAWAFLHAGAHNVIAGLWDVNDQATAALMDVLYREIASGNPAAEALRTAKLSLLRQSSYLRKPYYWGAFQIYTVEP